jgi:hypothetical protein
MQHQQIIQTGPIDFMILGLDTMTDTKEQEQWQISKQLFNDTRKPLTILRLSSVDRRMPACWLLARRWGFVGRE